MIVGGIKKIRKFLKGERLKNKIIGFVPTMGALHEGHLSLIRKCRKECDISVVSIFLNPLQFNDKVDLKTYPSNLKEDLKKCRIEKVDAVFTPSVKEMYPPDFDFKVLPGKIASKWEGYFRPHHFEGVCTVVLKLFNIVQPDVAYFGLKDLQQYFVIKKMVKDFNLPIKIKGCPTVREKDGLAMSSRNVRLSYEERKKAPLIFFALQTIKKMLLNGFPKKKALKKGLEILKDFKVEYLEVVDKNLEISKEPKKGDYIIFAGFLGKDRLIDNLRI